MSKPRKKLQEKIEYLEINENENPRHIILWDYNCNAYIKKIRKLSDPHPVFMH